jgi:DNA-binding response OmpR family regulator
MDLYTELQDKLPTEARKVVFLTGGAFTPALQAFLSTVPNRRIDKPFDVMSLKATVRAHLERVRSPSGSEPQSSFTP